MGRGYVVSKNSGSKRGYKGHQAGMAADRLAAEPTSLETKLGRKIQPQPNGCWLWRGHTDMYGHTNINGIRIVVHRFVYETLVGEIPEGFDIHHECETPACCNPAHLTPMTRSDHLLGHHARIRARRERTAREK